MIDKSMFDRRAKALEQVGDVISAVANYHSHIDVDDTTQERWRQLMGLMREMDTVTDTKSPVPNHSLRYLTRADSPFFTRYSALFPDQIEPSSYTALLKRARSIISIGEIASSTYSLDHYVSARTMEAKQTANILEDSATGYVRAQPQFQSSFMPLAREAAISANFYDSFVDAQLDYKAGRLKIRPDTVFYKRMGAMAVKHFWRLPPAAMHLPVLAQLGPMAAHGVFNKIAYDEKGAPRFTRRAISR